MRGLARVASAAAVFVLAAQVAAAQTSAPIPTNADAQRPASPLPPTAPKPSVPSAQAVQPAAKAHRWFDIQTGQVDARYRLIETSAGVRTSNLVQHRQILRGALKIDPRGRYTVQAGLGTGNNFTGSWEATGLGTGGPTWGFGVRTLYVSAQPVKGLELQAGGLGFSRGESTEITSYDNDGFLVGERIGVKRPAELLLDEITVTAGFLGDFNTPNVFKRIDRLGDHNYTQVLAAKKLGSRLAASIDWTRVAGVTTWRQGVRAATKEAGIIDGVRLELYERTGAPSGEGVAVSVDKTLSKSVSLAGGYATIDRNNALLNGDRYLRGRRLFVESRWSVTPELTASVFYSRAIHNDFSISNQTRFDAVVSYNVLKALQRARVW